LVEGVVVCCRGEGDVDVVVVQSEGAAKRDVDNSTCVSIMALLSTNCPTNIFTHLSRL
jgi:hypothetical protein